MYGTEEEVTNFVLHYLDLVITMHEKFYNEHRDTCDYDYDYDYDYGSNYHRDLGNLLYPIIEEFNSSMLIHNITLDLLQDILDSNSNPLHKFAWQAGFNQTSSTVLSIVKRNASSKVKEEKPLICFSLLFPDGMDDIRLLNATLTYKITDLR